MLESLHDGKFWLEHIKKSLYLTDTKTADFAQPGRGIFLGHAFTIMLEEGQGIIQPNHPYRLLLESVLEDLRAHDWAVHCALEREAWGANLMTARIALPIDFDQVNKADVLVTYPQRSPGAMMEIGEAMAVKTPTIILWRGSDFPTDHRQMTEDQYNLAGMPAYARTNGFPVTIMIDNSASLDDFHARVYPRIMEKITEFALFKTKGASYTS